MAFIDDILVYLETIEEHRTHVRKILCSFQDAGLYLQPEKCQFHVQETKSLGLIISLKGIAMDPAKVSTVKEWASPKTVKEVQAFLGLANFYGRFIKDYSRVMNPLTAVTKKGIKLAWNAEEESAYFLLKKAFTSAPVLTHFDSRRTIIIEKDTSDYVSAGVMSQQDEEGILHPVAFFSKKHSPTECNDDIYDKELLAVIRCFEE